MIIGIGVMKPCDNNENENEAKAAARQEPKCDGVCEKKRTPKPEPKAEAKEPEKRDATDMANALNMVAELLSEIAPEEHKPVLLAPSKGTKIVDSVHDMLRMIMEAKGMEATCEVAAIAVDAMNEVIITLDAAIDRMRNCVKEDEDDA